MAVFRFDKKKTLYDECKRVITELFQDIRNGLGAPPEAVDEGIHSARKATKKLRALLGVIDPVADRKTVRKQDAMVRMLAKQLGGARDSAVMLQTLKSLKEDFLPYIKLSATKNLELNLLKKYQDELHSREDTDLRQPLVAQLDMIESGVLDLLSVLEGREYDVLTGSLVTIYKDSRRDWKKARQSNKPEDFHRWRRKAKHLWYLARLIQDWNPDQLGPLVMHLNDLGETLGFGHDLYVLQMYIRQQPQSCETSRQGELVYSLIDIKQRMLQQDALVTALSVYSRKPGQFINWVKEVAGSPV